MALVKYTSGALIRTVQAPMLYPRLASQNNARPTRRKVYKISEWSDAAPGQIGLRRNGSSDVAVPTHWLGSHALYRIEMVRTLGNLGKLNVVVTANVNGDPVGAELLQHPAPEVKVLHVRALEFHPHRKDEAERIVIVAGAPEGVQFALHRFTFAQLVNKNTAALSSLQSALLKGKPSDFRVLVVMHAGSKPTEPTLLHAQQAVPALAAVAPLDPNDLYKLRDTLAAVQDKSMPRYNDDPSNSIVGRYIPARVWPPLRPGVLERVSRPSTSAAFAHAS